MRKTSNVEFGQVQEYATCLKTEHSCKMQAFNILAQNYISLIATSAPAQPRTDFPKFGLPVYCHSGRGTARTGNTPYILH